MNYIMILCIFIFIIYMQYCIDNKYKCVKKSLLDKLKLPIIITLIIIIINNYYKDINYIRNDINITGSNDVDKLLQDVKICLFNTS